MRGGLTAPRPVAWEDGEAVGGGGRSGGGGRKKGLVPLRTWLAVDAGGEAEVVEAGKQTIMRRTGLPARDLRILDPLLSYPSTILGRERAIVINLEHIKAIVTAHEVLILNHRDPSVAPFVRELQRRLLLHHPPKEGDSAGAADWSNGYDRVDSKLRNGSTSAGFRDHHFPNAPYEVTEAEEKGNKEEKPGMLKSNGSRAPPFEFIALEACLEAACSCLEKEATTLEKEAHPALDKLTSKISTLNLERVRQIKSRSVAITGRVQKVRDELEHLLDDDDDMAEMYLTDKLMQQRFSDGSSPHSSLNDRDDRLDADRISIATSSDESNPQNNYGDESQTAENHGRILSGLNSVHVDGYGVCSTRSGSKHLEVEELEMLLEAYFVQIDSTLNKLSTLREYVDDTEDYINIMLDDKQNHLLQMGVVLTTATLIVSAYVALAGIFGINIHNDLFDEKKSGSREFLWTVGGGATGSLFLYVIAMAWCKHRRLLE